MKCKHGMRATACVYCMLPAPWQNTSATPLKLANISKHSARDGLVSSFKPSSHPNKSDRNLGGKLDKVSDAAICVTDFSAEAQMKREGVKKVFDRIMSRIGPRKVTK